MIKGNLFKIVLFSLVLASLFSCKKLTTFTVRDSSEFEIPNGLGIGLPSIATPDVPTSSSYEFSSNDTDAAHVKEIRLSRLWLTILSPAGEDFSFLKDVEIYISAEGLPEVLLASKKNIPRDQGSTLEMDPSGEAFQEYIKKEKYKLRIVSVTDETLGSNIKVRADMEFKVRAKLIK